jgi:membrane protease YdiL (CAAX protease family)
MPVVAGPGSAPDDVVTRRWRLVAALEVALAVAAVLADLFLPTLVLLALAGLSLGVRRQGPRSLGLTRPASVGRLVGWAFAASAVWTALTLLLVMPVLEHATGEEQDVSQFERLEGDLGLLLVLLALSWTLAAVGEELAYRGFLLTRLRELLPAGVGGTVAAVAASSFVFGLAHTEQGVVGVGLATVDGAFYALLRLRFGTVWAGVLAHGFVNTFGMVAFYAVGPVGAPW